jgi:transposase
MQTVTTIGLDIAKSVFQVHGIDANGNVLIRRKLKRRYVMAFFEKLQPCLVGIEACATSHHWSRELTALGHTVRLMPPAIMTRQAPTQTTMCVRIPAAQSKRSRSNPMRLPRTAATTRRNAISQSGSIAFTPSIVRLCRIGRTAFQAHFSESALNCDNDRAE